MKYIYLSLVTSLFFTAAFSQVGIGTTTPTETLEVVGNAKLSGELFLENPGGFTTINGQKFLIETNTGAIQKLDVGTAKYGPINHATYTFNNVAEIGLHDFNTNIPASKYLLAIHGYSLGNSSTFFKSLSVDDTVEGFVFRAYKKGTPGNKTWWLQFYCNNSKFYNGGFVKENIILEVIIYRKNLLASDDGSVITVNMQNKPKANNSGNANTAPAPAKPVGY